MSEKRDPRCKYHDLCPEYEEHPLCMQDCAVDCPKYLAYENEALEEELDDKKEKRGEIFEAAYAHFESKRRIAKKPRQVLADTLESAGEKPLADVRMAPSEFYHLLREEEDDFEHWFLVECAAQKGRGWKDRREVLSQIEANKDYCLRVREPKEKQEGEKKKEEEVRK